MYDICHASRSHHAGSVKPLATKLTVKCSMTAGPMISMFSHWQNVPKSSHAVVTGIARLSWVQKLVWTQHLPPTVCCLDWLAGLDLGWCLPLHSCASSSDKHLATRRLCPGEGKLVRTYLHTRLLMKHSGPCSKCLMYAGAVQALRTQVCQVEQQLSKQLLSCSCWMVESICSRCTGCHWSASHCCKAMQ